MGFPENLKAARTKKGLTQEQLGEKIGVSKMCISQYESGQREPKIATLKLIAKVLKTTTDKLLK